VQGRAQAWVLQRRLLGPCLRRVLLLLLLLLRWDVRPAEAVRRVGLLRLRMLWQRVLLRLRILRRHVLLRLRMLRRHVLLRLRILRRHVLLRLRILRKRLLLVALRAALLHLLLVNGLRPLERWRVHVLLMLLVLLPRPRRVRLRRLTWRQRRLLGCMRWLRAGRQRRRGCRRIANGQGRRWAFWKRRLCLGVMWRLQRCWRCRGWRQRRRCCGRRLPPCWLPCGHWRRVLRLIWVQRWSTSEPVLMPASLLGLPLRLLLIGLLLRIRRLLVTLLMILMRVGLRWGCRVARLLLASAPLVPSTPHGVAHAAQSRPRTH
jgi:hypothetical protein